MTRSPSWVTDSGCSSGGGLRSETSTSSASMSPATRPHVYPPLAEPGGPLKRIGIESVSVIGFGSISGARHMTVTPGTRLPVSV